MAIASNFVKRLRRMLAATLATATLLACIPQAGLTAFAAENPSDGFVWVANPDGQTEPEAGQQGSLPVYLGEKMVAKTNKVKLNGTDIFTVQGANNAKKDGSNPNGAVPNSGAYIMVVAPADGTVTMYGINGSGKTFYATERNPVTEEVVTLKQAKGAEALPCTVSVKAGCEYYFYAQGSKVQPAAIVFELPRQLLTIPVELTGVDLGDSVITFSNGVTEDVVIGSGATSVQLVSGYAYTVSVNSQNLVINSGSIDLNSGVPESIVIDVAEAPKHIVSGQIMGAPAGSVSSLTFTDEANVSVVVEVTDGAYSVSLKNGNYTTGTATPVEGYEIFDHVAVAGVNGEAITNDVWFYASAVSYPAEYKETLTVGQDGDYATINEALDAAKAMVRTEGQTVTLVLKDETYTEQVIVDVPDIKMVAAEGVTPELNWYYGIGYKYYSSDLTKDGVIGYYSVKHANDKFTKGYANRWGAVMRITADNFTAEGISFVNTFNMYVSEAELADGVELGNAAEYGQSISSSAVREAGMDAKSAAATERAAAVVCDADNAEFYNCSFTSSQDTLYTGSKRSYFKDCLIIGQTDYIFGNTGCSAIFDNCELQWKGYSAGAKAGYITATRGSYLFRDCKITMAEDLTVKPGYFGRPWSNAADVVFLHTAIAADSMNKDGWYAMSGVNPEDASFREHGNYIDNGAPVEVADYFYSNYAEADLSFCVNNGEAAQLASPANDNAYLGSWVPSAHRTEAADLSNTVGWYLGKEVKVWKSTRFGASTSAVNYVAEGADIADKVQMFSASFKENGSINKKGGKLVSGAPADGLTMYYTTINPAEENFYLQADVTIDQMNPTPDGQEGFALIIRDMLGTEGNTGSWYSNMISVTGTKLPTEMNVGTTEVKNGIGVRAYTGIVDSGDATKNDVKPIRLAFSDEKMAQGETYRISLEKTDSAYVATRYAINDDGTTGEVIGSYKVYIPAADPYQKAVASYAELNDPLMVQDSEKAYVGLAVSRGVNATFSNIVFETSAWDASKWEAQPSVARDPVYTVDGPVTFAGSDYTLTFKADADGVITVKQDGAVIAEAVSVTANEMVTIPAVLKASTTEFTVEMTPNADFVYGPFEVLNDYSTKIIQHIVTKRSIGTESTIYVSNTGKESNDGTSMEKAVDLQTALNFAAPGQTILMAAGEYNYTTGLLIDRGIDGTAEKPINLTTEDGKYSVVIDFNRQGSGLAAWGNYWNFSKLTIRNSASGQKGMQLSGSHCVVECCNFYNNGSSGLQVSGTSKETIDMWPSYNQIINCTAINNADDALEDADGFAPKLTCGVGNVFYGCIAAYNADDGWDMFAKAETGSIGVVTVEHSVAYKNGYILVDEEGKLGEFTVNAETGDLTPVAGLIEKDAGNGNGFKMGGTNIPGAHVLKDCISYENKSKGIDSNSGPDIQIYNNTSVNNEKYNVALYTNSESATGYIAEGTLSVRDKFTDVAEQLKPQKQDELESESNYFWDKASASSKNINNATVGMEIFISTDTSVAPTRLPSGSINMNGLFLLKNAADLNAGARSAAWYVAPGNEANVTNPAENAFKADLELNDKKVSDVLMLDREEQIKLDTGSDLGIKLEVAEKTSLTAEEENQIKATVESKGLRVAKVLDITLYKVIDGVESVQTETKYPVKVTLEIPAELANVPANVERAYSVLRIHDGVVSVLECTVSGSTLTFCTDEFSTYVLTYSDTMKVVDNSGSNSVKQPVSPPTGDSAVLPAAAVFFFAACGAVAYLSAKRRNKG